MEEKGLFVEIEYQIDYLNVEDEHGFVNSYIPSIDMYFYSKSQEERKAIASIIGKAFIDSWVNDEGIGSFMRQLRVQGFEPSNGILDWSMLKKKQLNKPVIFKPVKEKTVPQTFAGGEVKNIQERMEMAF